MIVDGICIQFLGCFDCNNKTQEHSDIQQINGVGRVQLDEDYYRELSSTQVCKKQTQKFQILFSTIVFLFLDFKRRKVN
jgi:hypothetical protein